MGIGPSELHLLAALKRAGHVRTGGAVVEIGAQQLTRQFLEARSQIVEVGELFGALGLPDLPAPGEALRSRSGAEVLSPDAPHSDSFWRWLGLKHTAIDVDGSEGAIPLDLNFDLVPPEHVGVYDLVLNSGTTEHVANQINAMRIIHDLTRVGGVMLHILPAQGFTNHGLINYNLKFFWMLARSNHYKWFAMSFRSDGDPQPIDGDILSTLREYDAPGLAALENYRAENCGVLAVLIKDWDSPFVPPIDVPSGGEIDIEALRRRYWTVFDPALVESERAREALRRRAEALEARLTARDQSDAIVRLTERMVDVRAALATEQGARLGIEARFAEQAAVMNSRSRLARRLTWLIMTGKRGSRASRNP